ncbi:DUF2268 domain-containing putative Zn-dependent protease [uncultured Pluralibacter sp.]|uniref:DUF2268 domain-containing putative Zn-dependent protease n=1 Tax=uncultured Pluralibacter sp. TaxID=1490864 RepID=UPI002619C4F5|nr:DUF2268 domain-containing putative Zn-dependent protease [uncultured Pluralibacter sp.]
MTTPALHFLNARETLTPHKVWITSCLQEAWYTAAPLLTLPAIDIVIKSGTQTIPEKGVGAFTPEANVIYITLDPDSAALRFQPENTLGRLFLHELHHAARWNGPGYGFSLGEVIVSEGLAGQFVLEAAGGAPEPWEALDAGLVHNSLAAVDAQWESRNYSHAEWFFGAGALPRWLGYSVGFNLVAEYLLQNPDHKPSSLADADAGAFREYLQRM